MRKILPFGKPPGSTGEGGDGSNGESGDRWLYSVAMQVLALLPLEDEAKALQVLRIAIKVVQHLPDITQT